MPEDSPPEWGLRVVSADQENDWARPVPMDVYMADESRTLEQKIRAVELWLVKSALEKANRNVSEAARNLGVARATLYGKAAKLGIPIGRKRRCARVLVIDDDRMWRISAIRLLTARNASVSVAVSGNTATQLLAEDTYDVVLCDVCMPNGSGPDVFDWLEKHRPELLPHLVFVTGFVDQDERLNAILEREDAPRVLYKPVQVEDLEEAVRNAVSA